MRCPFCAHENSQVKDSRPTEDGSAIRRRRQCEECAARFTTFERAQLRELTVLKSEERREPFDRAKLERSIQIACRKRPVEPERIERFIHLVENDLGLPLHQSIERTKISLSRHLESSLDFREAPVEICVPLERGEFSTWIAEDLDKIDEVLGEVLDKGGVQAGDVQRVFTTGGSSFVPAVRERLTDAIEHELEITESRATTS